MEKIKIKPQTVIMFVGPAECGKTYFAQEKLLPFLEGQQHFINKKLNIQYISSDAIRAELLGVTYDVLPDDSAMDFVSEQAFTILKTKLAAVLSYPVNADFVVIDTTGMSDAFRKEVKDITYDANYNLHLFVFDYKDRDNYYEFVPRHDQTLVKKVSDSIKRFRDRMGELSKKDYPVQSRIKNNRYTMDDFEISDFDQYGKHFYINYRDYIIIGDVHGCYDELIALLKANGYLFDEYDQLVAIPKDQNGNTPLIVFIGDLIDKGEQIEEVIRFANHLIENGDAVLVRGNHENFVYNYLKGVKAYTDLGQEFINSFIQSVDVLNKVPELKEIFFKMFEEATDFVATDRFIVTHAPCKIKHLGKVRRESLKAQRNFRFARRRDFATEQEFVANAEKEMAFLKEESRYNNPYHIMGHVMLEHVVNFNNKYMIDTGCVAGGKLTSLTIGINGPPRIKSVKSTRATSGEIFPLFVGPKKFDIEQLDPKDQTRIKYLCLDKVNFISGTMAPADKRIESNTLESLTQGIEYYKNAGVKKLILQPKFMGSRGNVYLFKDVEKSYVVTRNGYLVKPQVHEQLKPLLVELRDRLFQKIFANKDVKMMILDCEILPWSLIGSGLINQHFKPVAIAVESETKQLVEHGFEDVLNSVKNSDEFKEYRGEYKTMKKNELSDKYGNTKEKTYRNLIDYNHLDLNQELGYSNDFNMQLLIHGSETEPQIEPFAVLKVVFEDDSEFLFEKESNILMYSLISQRPYAVLEFGEENVDNQVTLFNMNGVGDSKTTADEFYRQLTKVEMMEGVVIKPEIVYTPGIAPYIKVRNEDYLMIVYGHNYKYVNKFNKLIKKKGVKGKLNTSIKEFELGMQMLRTPYKDITTDNDQYKQLLAQMIIEVEKEKHLDPRL